MIRRWIAKNVCLRGIFAAVFLGMALSVQAEDIDDVEAGVDTALSESEAAVADAEAERKREEEEKDHLTQLKKESKSTEAEARSKEIAARKEIKSLHAKIDQIKAEQKIHIRIKENAEKKIRVLDQRLTNEREALAAQQKARDQKRSEKEKAQKTWIAKQEEEKALQKNISGVGMEIKAIEAEMAVLKKKSITLEKRLVKLRKQARGETKKLEELRRKRDNQKRNVSSIPTHVIVRSPKTDCQVLKAPADDSKSLGRVKKGQSYELYRVVNKRWVELQLGAHRGYAERNCF